MHALCKVVFVYIALTVSKTEGQTHARCNGGSECILLDDCTQLHRQLQLQRDTDQQFVRLLRRLHCGFEGDKPKFDNTGLTKVQKSSQQVRIKRMAARQNPTTEHNFFDLFWGSSTTKPPTRFVLRATKIKPAQKPTMKPTLKPLIKPPLKPAAGKKPTAKPKQKPVIKPQKKPAVNSPQKATVKPTARPTAKPTQRPLMKPAVKPSVRPQQRPLVKPTRRPLTKPAARPAVKPTVQTPVNIIKPGNSQVCCPPEFQGQPDYSSSSTTQSNQGYPDDNASRGGHPITNRPNNGNGGFSIDQNAWNNGGSSNSHNNFNTNSNGWNNNNNNGNSNGDRNGGSNGGSRGEVPSYDPTSLLPDRRNCGIQNNDRIVGGTRADLDEHPWMALLRYDKPVGWGFYCGGVLISSRYVLTAAHCVKGDDLPTNWRLSQVRLGEWNTSSVRDCVMDDCAAPVQDVAVEETIAHEDYNPHDANQHNDIALLRLARPVQINDFVKPICLPLSRDMKNNGFDGYTMEVAGWGKTEARSESEVKLKVEVPVVGRKDCANVFNKVGRQIVSKQLCAGGTQGKDSCRGDSGGALMGRVPTADNWFALGVVSYGPSPCGTPGWPGVYTRVGAYVDWILTKIRP